MSTLSRVDDLRARLVATQITHRQYLQLRNTVRVVRGAGVTLDPEQQNLFQKFQVTVEEYEHLQRKGLKP